MITWFVEDLFDNNSLLNSIEQNCKLIKVPTNPDLSNYKELLAREECIIFYGSLELASEILRTARWIPGVYRHLPRLRCSYYFPRLFRFLLNQDHEFRPFGEIDKFRGQDFFIRPDTGFKTFTGQIVRADRFDLEMKTLSYYNIPPEEICIVSPLKDIERECRFVIADGKVISGSWYKINGEMDEVECLDDYCYEYAQEVANQFQPEPVFTLDLAICNNKPYLLELNSFSCAGLYKCNTDLVVEAVNKVAINEYNSYY